MKQNIEHLVQKPCYKLHLERWNYIWIYHADTHITYVKKNLNPNVKFFNADACKILETAICKKMPKLVLV